MRIEESIEYELPPLDKVGLISTWHVPYSVSLKNGQPESCEMNGMPKLARLQVKVMNVVVDMDLPSDDAMQKAWLEYWCHFSRFIEANLMDLFCADAVERYWARRSEAA